MMKEFVMKYSNVFSSISMILIAVALLLDSNQIINEMMFSILLGISIGLGILSILIPCIKKDRKEI